MTKTDMKLNWMNELETETETELEKLVIAVHSQAGGVRKFVGFIVEIAGAPNATLNLAHATIYPPGEVQKKAELYQFSTAQTSYLTSVLVYKEVSDLLLAAGRGRSTSIPADDKRPIDAKKYAMIVYTPQPQTITPADKEKIDKISAVLKEAGQTGIVPSSAAEITKESKESKTVAITNDLENKFTIVVYSAGLKMCLKGLLKKDRESGNRLNSDMITSDFAEALVVSKSVADEICREYSIYSPNFSCKVLSIAKMKIELEEAKIRENTKWWKS